MNRDTFRQIVTAFADEAIDVDFSGGNMLAQIRDEIVDVKVSEREGTIWIQESGEELSAYAWIIKRLARLNLLADRILAQIPDEEYFVEPEGILLDIDSSSNDNNSKSKDASQAIENALDQGVAGITRILYLTSDAGEGKTTLINHVARLLAQKYKRKEASWLLVPISLAGRPFMALDDIVVAELTNRFRFNLYYDAFTEMVKLNALVPALDGFEEVFLETGSGEAVSALGNLINQLNGSGRVLIAARKAYFEIRSFASQARMFDTVDSDAGAIFEQLSLQRWSKNKFFEYAQIRGLSNPIEIHTKFANQLGGHDHPLLSRAVLVSRLIDVALKDDVGSLVHELSKDPEDYFFQFVEALIEREAVSKWIDRSSSGDTASPLLSVEEHFALLTQIAREMWINRTDTLGLDYIDLIADVFNSEHSKSAAVAHQVKERLHQHSLLASRGSSTKKLTFDHEDFRLFFLGQALGTELIKSDPQSIGIFLRSASIPSRTVDAAISYVSRKEASIKTILDVLVSIGQSALETSYEKENSGFIVIRLIEADPEGRHVIKSINFPPNSLRMRHLKNVEFVNCRFRDTEIGPTDDWGVVFKESHFDSILLNSDTLFSGVDFIDCDVSSIFFSDTDEAFFAPDEINEILDLTSPKEVMQPTTLTNFVIQSKSDTRLAVQALRAFLRATHLSEYVLRQRLGQNSNEFFHGILPKLLSSEILEEIDPKGSSTQRRFKLAIPMRNIEPAIRNASDLASFLSLLKQGSK